MCIWRYAQTKSIWACGQEKVIVTLDPELVQLLREHKMAAEWSQPNDFVFAGRIRAKPRERNSVRTRVLYGAIEKANELLAAEDRPPLPEGITFHALRRTYAALRAELGEPRQMSLKHARMQALR